MDTPYISNQEIARVLFQTAALLEMMEANPYRVRAYRRAALSVLFLPKQLVSYLGSSEEPPLPGVGERIRRRLKDLVNTGHMGSYDALLEEVGEPMLSLLTVEGIGPKTAIKLVSELQVSTLQDVAEAAETGKIRSLHGFGPKRESRIADAVRARLDSAA